MCRIPYLISIQDTIHVHPDMPENLEIILKFRIQTTNSDAEVFVY